MSTEKTVVYIAIGYLGFKLKNTLAMFMDKLHALGFEVDAKISGCDGIPGVGGYLGEQETPSVKVEFTEHMMSREFKLDNLHEVSKHPRVTPPINTNSSDLRYPQMRVSVIGQANTGKSSLIHYFSSELAVSGEMVIVDQQLLMIDDNFSGLSGEFIENNLRHLAAHVTISLTTFPLRRRARLDDHIYQHIAMD